MAAFLFGPRAAREDAIHPSSVWPHAVVPIKSAAGSAESLMDTEGYCLFGLQGAGLGRAGSR